MSVLLIGAEDLVGVSFSLACLVWLVAWIGIERRMVAAHDWPFLE